MSGYLRILRISHFALQHLETKDAIYYTKRRKVYLFFFFLGLSYVGYFHEQIKTIKGCLRVQNTFAKAIFQT